MLERLRLAIVFGGRSAEHEVSLQSARNILEALDRKKYEIVLLGIDRDGRWRLNEQSLSLLNAGAPVPALAAAETGREVALAPRGAASHLVDLSDHRSLGGIDVVFPVLHGPYGEDGSVQGLCKLANLPCVGAGILGSAVGMDKDVMKRLLRDAGIPIARFLLLSRGAPPIPFGEISGRLGLPLFVKPANLGSSVGISKVRTAEEYRGALSVAFRYDTKVLVEECITGREIECAVLGNADPLASVPGEILPSHDFYDYEAKYIDEHGAALQIPAAVAPEKSQEIRALAVRTFTVLCCDGMARVDMFLEPGGRLVVNEINTIPGFTRISMYPKLWEASGVPYGELLDRLIKLAREKFQVERELRTTV
jgi:D-alanine-D-alanine ligase